VPHFFQTLEEEDLMKVEVTQLGDNVAAASKQVKLKIRLYSRILKGAF
jgi:hypothetical protein